MRALTGILFLLFTTSAWAGEYGKVTKHAVADGVYLFTTSPYADVGFCGNSVAIISDEGVLLFDSAATPETAQAVLAEIRKLTAKPVRYLVNSHWHWDHWGGNQVFLEAFPGLEIITHEKNRKMMLEVEPRWNEKGLNEDLPQFLRGFEKQIADAKAKHLPEDRIKRAEERLAADRKFLDQKRSLRKTYPNLTFSDSLNIVLGNREIAIMHGSAITPGDTFVYLPKEKILITGDILLSPYPYAIGGTYPAEWLATLNRLAALDPQTIVPGHGEAVTGGELLANNIALFKEVIRQVSVSKGHGITQEQTVKALGEQGAELAAKVGIRNPEAVSAFKGYFLDVFVKRVYRELDGPLGDMPDGLQ
ncbi:MAG TPA: MBL fold metallo-hydrolase [Terriglobales bacterium]|nr:MBL fold metallo-hydrolase [Terriglobales bacterium]